MADRFIEIVVPAGRASQVREFLAAQEDVTPWHDPGDEVASFRLLVPAERVESILDPLQGAFVSTEGFRAVVMSVEASLPKPKPPDEEKPEPAVGEAKPPPVPERVSREELYEDLSDSARITRVYLWMVMLSAIVAVIGVVRNSPAILIGAMVIAPLLGPNVALALATTLGDKALARRSMRTTVAGLLLAAGVAFVAGLFVGIDPAAPEVVARTHIGLGDLVLALAAGTAGALAFTTGVPATLVGVMVAVALLPPLVVALMLLANGRPVEAAGAALLLAANIVCVNLAGVATFLLQGVSPRTWWEAQRSKRMTRRALLIWALLLIGLGTVVALAQWSGA